MTNKAKATNRVDELLDELLADDHSPEAVLGENGLLKQLSKRLVERALAGELSHHLNQSAASADKVSNSRNGHTKKTIQSEQGPLELQIPRDRNGSFEPVLVPKHQRRIAGLDEKILSLYARGMSTRDISAQLEELYGGAKVSAELISGVIETVSEDVRVWQSSPLSEVYPIVYLDALYVNIKVSGRVSKRAVYVVLGIDPEGHKQLMGLWVGEAETEGAKFWLKVLTEIVYTQMTKMRLLAFRRNRNYVANFYQFMTHDNPVNQKFNKLPLLLERRFLQSLLHSTTECFSAFSKLGNFCLLTSLRSELSLLSRQSL